MHKGLSTAIRRQAARFGSDSRGSVLPMFTLALIPLVAVVGSVVDYSRAASLRQSMQVALDAAILAGAGDGTANWAGVALDTFNNNLPANVAASLCGLTSTFAPSGPTWTATVSASAKTNFMGVMGFSSVSLAARSVAATRNGTAGQFCVLALNMSASPALTLNGNASINIMAS